LNTGFAPAACEKICWKNVAVAYKNKNCLSRLRRVFLFLGGGCILTAIFSPA